MQSTIDEDVLVQSAIAGDQVALGRLLLRHTKPLRQRIVSRIPAHLRSSIDCEDMLQQTFVRIVRDLGQLRELHADGFASWATRVAENCCRDMLRSIRARKRGSGRATAPFDLDAQAGAGSSPSRGARRVEIAQALQGAIKSLPREQRKAVANVFLRENSFAATAQEMGRSYSAVRSLAHRAKKQLRAAFGSPSDWL